MQGVTQRTTIVVLKLTNKKTSTMSNTQQEGRELKTWIEEQKKVCQEGYIKATDEESRIMYASENITFGIVLQKMDTIFTLSPPTIGELKTKFAQHLGVPDLDTTDAYAVEWTAKELK